MTNKFHRMAALLFAAVLVWSVFAPAAFAADSEECPEGGEHIWLDDGVIWSTDNMTVTFSFECISCGQRVERTVNTTSEITKWPTCTEPGRYRGHGGKARYPDAAHRPLVGAGQR